jgi:N6-L-threonylcarbamoyladenine synthase
MRILGIETSCDETSAAVLLGDSGNAPRLESLVILSQDVHGVFGGVVPELASRAHLTALVPTVEKALADANTTIESLDAVAVTHAPGLVGALLVGVCFGKALAASRGIPVIGVHHMEGHLFATSLENPKAEPPFTALLVSGGHTMLLDVPEWGRYQLLGNTRDDAAGEAFDKVAKMLGMGYPGGPAIERLAAGGDPERFRFARPMLRRDQRVEDADYFDMSFSGLKTAVRNAAQGVDIEAERSNLARGFQDALIETLVEKTARAAKYFARRTVVLGGGVACNRALVDALSARLAPSDIRVYAPGSRLATDNAAMIARAGLFHIERGETSRLDLDASASLPLPGLIAA